MAVMSFGFGFIIRQIKSFFVHLYKETHAKTHYDHCLTIVNLDILP